MTKDVKLLKRTLGYIREEVDELIKREARLKREIKALKEENDELEKGVKLRLWKSQAMQRMLQVERQCYLIEEDNKSLRQDKLRLDWLLDKAYTIQLRDGDILTCRASIDIAMEEELKQPK